MLKREIVAAADTRSASQKLAKSCSSPSTFRKKQSGGSPRSKKLEEIGINETILPSLQRRIEKTKLCVHHANGRCLRGDSCSFAHSRAELRETPDLKKTRLCALFLKGECSKNADECAFAHSDAELRATPDLYKTSMCPLWTEKDPTLCQSGDKCRYAHGSAELRHKRRQQSAKTSHCASSPRSSFASTTRKAFSEAGTPKSTSSTPGFSASAFLRWASLSDMSEDADAFDSDVKKMMEVFSSITEREPFSAPSGLYPLFPRATENFPQEPAVSSSESLEVITSLPSYLYSDSGRKNVAVLSTAASSPKTPALSVPEKLESDLPSPSPCLLSARREVRSKTTGRKAVRWEDTDTSLLLEGSTSRQKSRSVDPAASSWIIEMLGISRGVTAG